MPRGTRRSAGAVAIAETCEEFPNPKARSSKVAEKSGPEDLDNSHGTVAVTVEQKIPRRKITAANEATTKDKSNEDVSVQLVSVTKKKVAGTEAGSSRPSSSSNINCSRVRGAKNVKKPGKTGEKLDMSVGKVTGLDDDDDRYYVEKILDYKIVKGKEFFLIKWSDWSEEYNNWEPGENVEGSSEHIKQFFKTNPRAKKRHEKFVEKARAEAQSHSVQNPGNNNVAVGDESPEPGQNENQAPHIPRASIVIGESLYSYISENMIQNMTVKVPYEIIALEPGIIPAFIGDRAILVLWTQDDIELRVVLESVARKYFPEKLNEFLDSEDISEGIEDMEINGGVVGEE